MQVAVEAGKPSIDGKSYGHSWYMGYVLFMLFLVYGFYGMDRSILLVLVEPIKHELSLSDTQIGFISGPAFSIFFAVFGIPFGLLADRRNRRNLIAILLAAWSIATGFCGAAQSFVQMAVGRAAVGTGIAGGLPASMAMISDIFPAERRATAMSVFYVGGAVGTVVAFGGGGWAAAHYGWRATLVMAAVPGIVVAVLLYFTVREPRRGMSDGRRESSEAISVRHSLGFICRQRSVVQTLLGLFFQHMVGGGLMTFIASFLIRSHGMTLAEAGGMISLVYFLISPLSQLGAGFLADFLGKYDIRWRLRLATLGSVLCMAGICLMAVVDSRTAVAVCFAGWVCASGLNQSPIYALMQTMVKPQMRATMGSMQFVLATAIGQALGPLFVGTMSDYLSARVGQDSLRYALFALSLFYLWAMAHFILGEPHLKTDLMRVEAN